MVASFGLVDSRGFDTHADIPGAVARSEGMIQQRERGRQLGLTSQVLENKVQNLPLANERAQLGLESDKLGLQSQQTSVGLQDQQALIQKGDNTTQALIQGASELKNITSPEGKVSFLQQQMQRFQEAGLFTGPLEDALELAEAGKFDELAQNTDRLIEAGQQRNQEPQSVKEREFEALIKNLSPEQQDKARRVKLGLDARAVGSGQITTAITPGLSGQVAESQERIKGAEERGKLKEQQKLLPKIRGAIKEAEDSARARGETLSELNRAKAGMPGVIEVVDKLKSLTEIATFTGSGKLFNEAAKQFGFSTKAGTARSQMAAIVDNQVLPLLRETFGSAFTENEGARLRNALLDSDATPDSKRATLNAFLEQKKRNIAAQERELELSQEQPAQPAEQPAQQAGQRQGGQIMIDANGNRARVFEDGTFEEL